LNDYVVSILLGIIEGLTEFLPVSSTAHLRIGEALLDISLDNPYWKMYTIVIQLGAILALTLLFAGRVIEFIRTFPTGEDGKHTAWNHPLTLVSVAFVSTAIPSLLLTNVIGAHLENLRAISWALIIGGLVMWTVDAWSVRHDPSISDIEQMTLPRAIWIGLCQVTSAVFPGTSRSMSTIFAATLYDLIRSLWPNFHVLHMQKPGALPGLHSHLAPVAMDMHGWMVLILGFVISFFVALGVVEWFLQWVRNHGFIYFAVYRLILGGILLYEGSRRTG
jgi:undecaprenyl-diphosphatase